MAWIAFHGAQIVKLQKFADFRRSLQWSVNEALGFLGSFWSEVMELREDGNIAGWRPEYICELTHVNLDPERVWNALVTHHWINVVNDEKMLINDWIEYNGVYLVRKYSENAREKLVSIWELHGMKYGSNHRRKKGAVNKRSINRQKQVVPFLSFHYTSFPLPTNTTQEGAFDLLWSRYPKQDGKKDAYRHFCASVYEVKDWEDINLALQNYLNSERVKKGFVKNGSTWFNNWKDWINYKEVESAGKSGLQNGYRRGDNTAGTVDTSKYDKAGIPD